MSDGDFTRDSFDRGVSLVETLMNGVLSQVGGQLEVLEAQGEAASHDSASHCLVESARGAVYEAMHLSTTSEDAAELNDGLLRMYVCASLDIAIMQAMQMLADVSMKAFYSTSETCYQTVANGATFMPLISMQGVAEAAEDVAEAFGLLPRPDGGWE